MRNSKRSIWVLAILVFVIPANAQTVVPALGSIEGHIAAGKNAAGGRDDTPDFYGLVTAICVSPLSALLGQMLQRPGKIPIGKAHTLNRRKLSTNCIRIRQWIPSGQTEA